MNNDKNQIIENSVDVSINSIKRQAEALVEMSEQLTRSDDLKKTLQLILNNGNDSRRVIVTGVGKSGHIGRKIAATLASTGTKSYFVHSTEAFHGDLGMIRSDDIVVMVSNSGETEEVIKLIPVFKRWGNPIISITGNPESTMAKAAYATLLTKIPFEVCPNKLAPTTSTTAALVVGDAIACGLIHAKNFNESDFAEFHPGGSLGKKLLSRVKEHTVPREEIPAVSPTDTIYNAFLEMTSLGHSICFVEDEDKNVIGVLTDGDIRRKERHGSNKEDVLIKDLMTDAKDLFTISEDFKLEMATARMEEMFVKQLIVTNREKEIIGIVKG